MAKSRKITSPRKQKKNSKKSPKRSPRKSMKRSSKKSPKRSPRKSFIRTKSACNQALRKKIRLNMDEYKKGRYSSRQQALAVSYSQIKKSSPYCRRYFRK
jgi:hypothetical protein